MHPGTRSWRNTLLLFLVPCNWSYWHGVDYSPRSSQFDMATQPAYSKLSLPLSKYLFRSYVKTTSIPNNLWTHRSIETDLASLCPQFPSFTPRIPSGHCLLREAEQWSSRSLSCTDPSRGAEHAACRTAVNRLKISHFQSIWLASYTSYGHTDVQLVLCISTGKTSKSDYVRRKGNSEWHLYIYYIYKNTPIQ